MDIEELKKLLIQDEGLRLHPYTDSRGIITIGVGRNLMQNGISEQEAMLLLANDVFKACRFAKGFFWFDGLTPKRQMVVVSMIYNLGYLGFMGFPKLITHLAAREYNQASNEMMNSRWAEQVKDRARRLSDMMRLG